MTNSKELMLKIVNNYLGYELSELNHVEQNIQNIIELSIQATTKEIFKRLDTFMYDNSDNTAYDEIKKEFGVEDWW